MSGCLSARFANECIRYISTDSDPNICSPSAVSERILARDPMEEIRRAFQLFDDDNTGKISLRNLRRVAKEIGDRLEDDEL